MSSQGSGFPSAAPLSSPVFTGTVTLPDGSTVGPPAFGGLFIEGSSGLRFSSANSGALFYGFTQFLGGLELEGTIVINTTHSLTSAVPYTPVSGDVLIINPAGINRTLAPNLASYTGPLSGNPVAHWLVTKGAGAITITPQSPQLINGQASWTLPGNSAAMLWTDTTNWWIVGQSGGANTSVAAIVSTPAPVTGTAFQPSPNQDCQLSFAVATAGSYSVTYGPSTGAENNLISPALALGVGTYFSTRVPAGWRVVITGTIANLQNILAVTC